MPSAKLYDLIADIHALDRELQKFEERYTVFSDDFYRLYKAGRLRDEEIEEIDEYGRWAALYSMRLRRMKQYDQEKSQWLGLEKETATITLTPYAPAGVL